MKQSSVKANFAFQLCYQLFTLLVPLVTAPYLARTIGAEGTGIYAYNYAIAYYFVLITKLGIDNYGSKKIAESRTSGNTSEVFWNLFSFKACVGILALTVYILYVCLFVKENTVIALIFTVYILSAIIDINWFYVGMENFRLISIRNIVVKSITVVCIFVFVHSASDLTAYTFIMVFGTYLLSQFIGWGYVIKHLKLCKINVLKSLKENFKPMVTLFVPVLAMSIYSQMDKIMLGLLSNNYQVGIYEYSEKIIKTLTIVISVCGDVGMPRIVTLRASGKEDRARRLTDSFMDFCSFAAVAMFFGIIAIVDIFIPLFYGNDYAECVELVSLLAITVIFWAGSIITRKEYLIPYNRENVFIAATVAGAVVNLALNWILIPTYAAKGAIIATVLTEFTVMVCQFICVRKELPLWKYCKHFLWFACNGFIMYCAIRFVFKDASSSWITVFLEICFGAVIYLLLSLIFFRKVYRDEYDKVWNRIKGLLTRR